MAYGGEATGPSPVDRGKPGSKHHLITDAGGIPLASSVTAANVNDISQLAPLFNALAAVAGTVGHPRTKPDALQGDPRPARINVWPGQSGAMSVGSVTWIRLW